MSEERTEEELEHLVEAQARGEEPEEAEAPAGQQSPQERKLDRRVSKRQGVNADFEYI